MSSNEGTPDTRYLAIDGGGSKTTIVIVDADGEELIRVDGKTSNPSVIGLPAATGVLVDLINDALNQNGATGTLVKSWAGLSGFGRATDQAALRPVLDALLPDLRLTNDVELVLGALPGTTGIALIAGTGSIVAGRNEQGAFVRVGGWGHLLGDEGSGYDLGKQALHAIAEQIDGRGPETALTPLIFEEWEIAEPYELITRTYDPAVTKADIARLAKFPLDLAYRKDPVSIRIVESAASELARMVATAARKLGFAESLPLAMTGGMLIHHLIMRDKVLAQLREEWPVIESVIVIDPALAAARALAGHWGVPA
jgi:N-acetylglucosamine kinase-like BadF-type ATPase